MANDVHAVDFRSLFDPANLVRLYRNEVAMDTILKAISESEEEVIRPQADGSSTLHNFALLGSYEIIKLLWEKGARPSILKKDNFTLLHSTVRTQCRRDSEDVERAKILDFFLSSDECQGNSLPINYTCSKGWTALKLATRKNLERCVEVLLERGADPDIPDNENYTPLHNAIANPAIVKLLATRSKSIDATNKDEETALYAACDRGLVDTALTLLEYKANANIPNKEGITPLFLAARTGNLELVKGLVRNGANISTLAAAQSIGALHWAAHKESEGVAVFLIENGADVLQADREGRTPLSMASRELAAKMIVTARKINPSLSIPDTTVPVMSANDKAVAACCGGNLRALQVLIQSGVSVDYPGGTSGSALIHMSAYFGQTHIVLYLLQQGADWKAVDKEGDTLLHFACMKEVKTALQDKTLDVLLNSPVKCLINKQNFQGNTPIMIAARCGVVSKVRVLLQNKADVTIANSKNELPLHKSCTSDGSIETLLYLAELSPDLNIQDNDGWSPLMYASKTCNTAIVKYLLQRGVDPNIQQNSGFTALYLAAQAENVTVCRLLLGGGADPNLSGGTQKLTPLHIAANRNSLAVCLTLVEHGANINLPDNDGDTPLSLAEETELKQTLTAAYLQYCSQPRSTGVDNQHIAPVKPPPSADHSDLLVSNEPDQRVSGDDVDVVSPGQEAFSKDEQLVGGALSQTRYREVLHEVCSLKESLAELKADLNSSQQDKQLVISRNKLLSEDLQRLEMLMLAHHMDKGLVVTDQTEVEQKYVDRGHAWWLVCRSQYEITGEQLNNEMTTGKCFDVYPGTYRQLPAAVKVVRNVKAWRPEVYQTFFQEIDNLSRLHCPWVVQFMGCRVDMDTKQCVVLVEYMEHGSLHSVLHLTKSPLEWKQRVKIVRDVSRGMLFLHSHDMLHRNLVPRNILIGEALNAKVSHFGLWETQNALTDGQQSLNEAPPPQAYMSPEAMESLQFTQAADVYSFGIIMCEVATGVKPFSDLGDTSLLLAVKVLMGHRPTFSCKVPANFQRTAEACWHAEPEERPTFETVEKSLLFDRSSLP